jgi:thioesterase domain-containing protein
MLTDGQRAALTARLRQGRTAAAGGSGGVVPLGGSGPVAAFAVHAVGGSVHEYAPLARCLDGVCRVYGIQAAGLRGAGTPVSSLAAMADRYAGLVRGAPDGGPYRLVGWSMGGVLAYETARRLEAAGERVALVALVDAPYRTVPRYADSDEGLAALFVADALRAAGRSPEAVGEVPVAGQLARLAARLAPDPGERAALVGELERRYALFVAHTTALADYQPAGPVAAAGVLVTAHGSRDAAPYWRPLFRGGARAVTTTAGHYGCLRPPAVATVATAIRAAL